MNTDDSSKLIERYFLGIISESEMECLDAQLRSDAALRDTFAATARLDTNLREAALQLEDEHEKPNQRISLAKSTLWAGLAAAAALIVATWLFLWPKNSDIHNFARLVEVGGGSLESLSANSWAEIALEDGSRMSLFGQSAMTISQSDEGSIIRLREGSLSAEVTTVRERKPMCFLTPTAKAEVLGTQFTLRADSSSTRLIVYEGRVRATRLADGSTTKLSAVSAAATTK